MEITNTINGKTTQQKVELCCTLLSQIRGLMFRREPASLLFIFNFDNKHGIHSMFCNFRFDCIYLDSNHTVVDFYRSLDTWKVFTPKKKNRYLLELPEGSIDKLELKEGDKLELKYS